MFTIMTSLALVASVHLAHPPIARSHVVIVQAREAATPTPLACAVMTPVPNTPTDPKAAATADANAAATVTTGLGQLIDTGGKGSQQAALFDCQKLGTALNQVRDQWVGLIFGISGSVTIIGFMVIGLRMMLASGNSRRVGESLDILRPLTEGLMLILSSSLIAGLAWAAYNQIVVPLLHN